MDEGLRKLLQAHTKKKAQTEADKEERLRLLAELVYLSRQSLIGVNVLTDRHKALVAFLKENFPDE